jgi:hypothetical protein
MSDPLLPWAPFFYSFGPALFAIKILADWWKLRLYYPLRPVEGASLRPSEEVEQSTRDRNKRTLEQYENMSYQQLRNEIVHGIMESSPELKTTRLSADELDYLVRDAIFAGKAEKRYHIHHFLFGIPLSFLSWGLFVYGQNFWGLIFAGIVAALFLSELKELMTQEWEV